MWSNGQDERFSPFSVGVRIPASAVVVVFVVVVVVVVVVVGC